jgi:hypothetical protein
MCLDFFPRGSGLSISFYCNCYCPFFDEEDDYYCCCCYNDDLAVNFEGETTAAIIYCYYNY